MSRIVAVHSFRGGTGKSNVTASLAATLASDNKRVGIVDTDVQSPGIHILFGLDEARLERSLNDYIWGQCKIEDAAYDVSSVLTPQEGPSSGSAGSIHLVPSSIKAGEIARVLREGYDVELLNDGFRDLVDRLKLDYLFIDTHPGLNEETLLSIAVADILLVILRPDEQDYQGTAVTVEVARKLDVPEMLIVVNKVLASFDFEALQRQVQEIYQVPVAGVLPLSDDLVRLASAGIFSLAFPEHAWTLAVQAVAARIAE